MEQYPSTPRSTHRRPSPQNPPPPPVTALTSVPPTPSSLLPSATASSFPNPNANLTPAPEPHATPQSQESFTTSQARPTFGTRPWPQQPSYSQFSSPSLPNPASPPPTTSSISAPPFPRGEVANGVPPQIPSPPPSPPASFSSLTLPSYGQQSQIRQPMQGIGITGTLGTASSMRPTHQFRPPTRPLRPQASSSWPSPARQNFQGHGMHRAPSLRSPGSSPSPSSSQTQSQTRPWLSPRTQGKPPLPTPILRPQVGPQSFQPRFITQKLQHNLPIITQQQPIGSNEQSFSHQQQVTRGPGSGRQRPALGMTQSWVLHSGAPSKTGSVDTNESLNRIVSKRIIQEIVNQIDPSEKLDPEVEDILVDVAQDFVETITTFGCSLAKHRKSTTLQAKDIMLHLERNWNMTLPGFGGDEINMYKKPVKKLISTTEMMGKTSVGPPGTNSKSHLAKAPAANIGAPLKSQNS